VDISRFGMVAASVTRRSPIVAIGRTSLEIRRVPILATEMKKEPRVPESAEREEILPTELSSEFVESEEIVEELADN